MGGNDVYRSKIFSKSIEIRNEVFQTGSKRDQNIPHKLAIDFSIDAKFEDSIAFESNTKPLKKDFVCFYSTVEGSKKLLRALVYFFLENKSKSLKK